MSGFMPWLSSLTVIGAAWLAAWAVTSSSRKVHLLDKKRDVILEITNEIANLRNYVIRKAITKPQIEDKDNMFLELQQLTEKLTCATDKFYVISSDYNCARLEKLYLILITKMTQGIKYHYDPKMSCNELLKTEYMSTFNDLRADIIEILNDELNDKEVKLTNFKSAIKETNIAMLEMLKSQK